MGMCVDRFHLYRRPLATPRWLLVRVTRPAAPGAAQPAVDFANDLADAIANKIAGTIDLDAEHVGSFVPLLADEEPVDQCLLSLHGRPLVLWWTRHADKPERIACGPTDSEGDFWNWLDEFVDDRTLASYRRPAQRIEATLATQADFDWSGRELLLVDDVDWLTAEEFDWLHRRDGLAELLEAPLVSQPASLERWRTWKLDLLHRALADDDARDDRRSAAFRCIELTRYDPDGALERVLKIAATTVASDDVRGIAYALASALVRLESRPAYRRVIEVWSQSSNRLERSVVDELAKLRD